MTIRPKLKTCSVCGHPRRLWRSSPPTCRDCSTRASVKNVSQKMRQPIKVKPRPTVNGMQSYVALYMACFGYGKADFISSELSNAAAIDVHHLICRGVGSSKNLDRIENLMAVTREEHIEYGDKKHYMSFLFRKHRDFLISNGVKFNSDWIEKKIEEYSIYE